MSGAPWTAEQIDGLRRLYPDYEADVVAKVIGRTTSSVHRKAAKLGIAKSEAFTAAYLVRQAARARNNPGCVAAQFKRGLVPWNTGKKIGTSGRAAETQFKKGDAPRNTLPLGSYRINPEGNLQRKVAEASGSNSKRWRNVAELLWCEAHGPLPEKHIVVFKLGMRTAVLEEITLDKVECITLAENLKRNSWRVRYPELAGVVQLKGAITRQTNRIKRMARTAEEAHS